MRLQGKNVLVTGAGRGIGRAIALRLAAEGADVALAARSADALAEVAAAVQATGRRAVAVPTDITDEDAVHSAVAETTAALGSVDCLVANSGVGGPSAPLADQTLQGWQETFAVNVFGTFLCCREVLPGMLAAGRGAIIVIGSLTGLRPLLNRTPYAASKTALIGMIRTLATEVGPSGVRVNLVSPGAVEGERLAWVLEQQAEAQGSTVEEARMAFASAAPLRRLVQKEDVAATVAFLASDDAAAITGENLSCSAGLALS